jgi:hypothetical protein
MRRFAIALMLMGLVLGPGYYALTAFFSGSEVLEQRFGEKGARFTLSAGDVLTFSGANAFRPVEIELDPVMNTIGFVLVFDMVGDTHVEPVRGNAYRALLLANGAPLFEKAVTVSRGTELGPNQLRSERVATLNVSAAGKYVFVLQETKASELPLAGITLQVRRNVAHTRMGLVWSGVVLLVAGVIAFFLGTRGVTSR